MSTAAIKPIEGHVNGEAPLYTFVHYCDLTHLPGTLYVVVDIDPDADEPYLLKNLTTWEKTSSDLKAAGWTFRARPDTIVGVTVDHRGNRLTHRIDADPHLADPQVTIRRLLKRHFVRSGVVGIVDHWHWTRRPSGI